MNMTEVRFDNLSGFFKEHIAKKDPDYANSLSSNISKYESAELIGNKFSSIEEVDNFARTITPPKTRFENLFQAGEFYSKASALLEDIIPSQYSHITKEDIFASIPLAKEYLKLKQEQPSPEIVNKTSLKTKFAEVRKNITNKISKAKELIPEAELTVASYIEGGSNYEIALKKNSKINS